jgi:hypothetical protein
MPALKKYNGQVQLVPEQQLQESKGGVKPGNPAIFSFGGLEDDVTFCGCTVTLFWQSAAVAKYCATPPAR